MTVPGFAVVIAFSTLVIQGAVETLKSTQVANVRADHA
jgi:hypothetical protein